MLSIDLFRIMYFVCIMCKAPAILQIGGLLLTTFHFRLCALFYEDFCKKVYELRHMPPPTLLNAG